MTGQDATWGIIIPTRDDEVGEEMAERETLAGVLK